LFSPLTPKNRSAFASVFFCAFFYTLEAAKHCERLQKSVGIEAASSNDHNRTRTFKCELRQVYRLSRLKTKGNPHMEDFARNISTDGVEDLDR
jgi:hypothetical protein